MNHISPTKLDSNSTLQKHLIPECNLKTTPTKNGSKVTHINSNNKLKTDNFSKLSKPNKSSWIKLNVGGQQFMTTRSTLCRYPRSFLAVLCQPDTQLESEKDEDGAFLIDRDPTYFSVILNFLRHGKLILNAGIKEEAIVEEAEFYNLPALVQICEDRIKNRNEEKEHVYRVFNFSETELPSVISNISDGWKISQFVYYYRQSFESPMFICIMYKEFVKRERSSNMDEYRTTRLQYVNHFN